VTLAPLGSLYVTPAAIATLGAAGVSVFSLLARHARGDWGDVNEEDSQENELSVLGGFRILSVYHLQGGAAIWIITEADRSSATVLLPGNTGERLGWDVPSSLPKPLRKIRLGMVFGSMRGRGAAPSAIGATAVPAPLCLLPRFVAGVQDAMPVLPATVI
jgi:hypothetical protein